MKIWILIEKPMSDDEPYVQAFPSRELALEHGAENYRADCQERELSGDILRGYVVRFKMDLKDRGVYYCDQSESVFYLVERDLLEVQS